MKSDLSDWVALDDAAPRLPARPIPQVDREPVDLLADPARRHLPEGTIPGFGALAALVVISCLVGGLTGGLVVVGVSTLLSASAALVLGRLSLARVGGQRGARVLLGVGVTALIVGSVTTHDRGPAATVPGSPVAAESARGVESETAYAALRTPAAPTPRATGGAAPSAAVSSAVPAVPAVRARLATPSSSATPSNRAILVGTASPAIPEATGPQTGRATGRATAGGTAGPAAGLDAVEPESTPAREALTLSPGALDPRPATLTATLPAAPVGATLPKAPKPSPAGKTSKPKTGRLKAAKPKTGKPKAAKPKTGKSSGKTSPGSGKAVADRATSRTKAATSASPRPVLEWIELGPAGR